MSRKRKQDKPATETATEQPPADVAAAVAEPPVAQPPVAESKAESRTFAEKVGQKKWIPIPDPYPIVSDPEVGIKLFESVMDEQMAFKFGDGSPKDKPSQRVLDKMHQAGYQWKSADRIWAFPLMPHSAMTTRIAAEKLYQELRHIIRQEKGIESASPDIAF
jgi:hypothetical protein